MKNLYNIYGAETFGSFMKKKRKEANLTFKQLAEKLDLGIGYLGDIESGRATAPKRYLDQLVEELNITDKEDVEKFYYLANISRNDTCDIYARKVLEDKDIRDIVKLITNGDYIIKIVQGEKTYNKTFTLEEVKEE